MKEFNPLIGRYGGVVKKSTMADTSYQFKIEVKGTEGVGLNLDCAHKISDSARKSEIVLTNLNLVHKYLHIQS
ncbi:hypothetical protein [Jeotgalibacillus proteolyticus]|uniref:Uncharacterized protein n=1 Tax=Jeotgalibacillus proteolyticus TaxID=2082395 RepID=A0A2S5G9G0_9BACL|nr:hypothetical protein [Jeotgalibacillus proteolyticus]PPA69626.1 hypothetical protein C4B60_13845 [Jeotgalibacillus proteolyticus]